LFIGAGVQIANLAREFGGDDAVGGDESVCEGSLAMVLDNMLRGLWCGFDGTYDVCQYAYLYFVSYLMN
jgi:hypothetical protein